MRMATNTKAILIPVVVFVSIVLTGVALRYGWIQPAGIGFRCMATDRPGWCAQREWLISFAMSSALGIVAIAIAVTGIILASRQIATLAVGLAGAGLVLYSAELSALALVIAVIALAGDYRHRTSNAHDAPEHRTGIV